MKQIKPDIQMAFEGLKLTRCEATVLCDYIKSRSDNWFIYQHSRYTPRRTAMHLARARAKLSHIQDQRIIEGINDNIEDLTRSLGKQKIHQHLQANHPSELVTALLKVLRSARWTTANALTDRQELILLLHCCGISDGLISKKLDLHKSTVHKHRIAAKKKIEAHASSSIRLSRNRWLCRQLLDMAEEREHRAWGKSQWADPLLCRANLLIRRLQILQINA